MLFIKIKGYASINESQIDRMMSEVIMNKWDVLILLIIVAAAIVLGAIFGKLLLDNII